MVSADIIDAIVSTVCVIIIVNCGSSDSTVGSVNIVIPATIDNAVGKNLKKNLEFFVKSINFAEARKACVSNV